MNTMKPIFHIHALLLLAAAVVCTRLLFGLPCNAAEASTGEPVTPSAGLLEPPIRPGPSNATRSFVVGNAADIASHVRTNERVAQVQYGFSRVEGQQIRVFVVPLLQSTRPGREGLESRKGPERTEQIEKENARQREADRLAGRNTEYAKRHETLQKGRMAVQVGQTLQDVVKLMGQPDVIYFSERIDDDYAVSRPGTIEELIGSGEDGFLIYSPFEDYSLRRPYPKGIVHYYNVSFAIGKDLRVQWIGSK